MSSNYALYFFYFLFFLNDHMIAQMEWVKCGAFIRLAGKAAGIKETNVSLLRWGGEVGGGGAQAFGAMMDGWMWSDCGADMHYASAQRFIDQRRSSAVAISSRRRRREGKGKRGDGARN